MTLNRSWFIFYGLKMGMARRDVLSTRYGEFMDLMSCWAIFNGTATEKKTPQKKHISFEELLKLR